MQLWGALPPVETATPVGNRVLAWPCALRQRSISPVRRNPSANRARSSADAFLHDFSGQNGRKEVQGAATFSLKMTKSQIAAERERISLLPDPARIARLIRKHKKQTTVSVTEAARVWGYYSPAHLLKLIESGLFPNAKKTIAGKQYRIPREDVYETTANRSSCPICNLTRCTTPQSTPEGEDL